MKNITNNRGSKGEFFESLFENNNSIFLLIDSFGTIVFANKAASKYYQYSIQELNSMKYQDLCDLNEEVVQAEMNKVFLGKQDSFQCNHRLANGEIRNVEVFANPIIFANQNYLFLTVKNLGKKRQEELMIIALFKNAPNAMTIVDQDFCVLAINKSFTHFFGYQQEEVVNHLLPEVLLSGEKDDEIGENLKRVLNGEIINQDVIRKAKNGKTLYVNIVALPYQIEAKVLGALIVYTDIQEKIQVKHDLEVFKKIIQNNSDGIIITNAQKEIQWVNDAFTEITGYTQEEALGKDPRILNSAIQNRNFYVNMWNKIEKNQEWQGEIWDKKKNGEIYPQWLHIFAIKNSENEVINYISIFKDLGQIDSVNKKILLMLQKDPLTSLYNRTYFMEEANNRLQKRGKNQKLVFLDIDNFKTINDTYGHKVGDDVLISFSKRLIRAFSEHLIGRFGGDEFLLFITGLTKKKLMEKIEALNFVYKNNDIVIPIACSLGIIDVSGVSALTKDMIGRADFAMYESKKGK